MSYTFEMTDTEATALRYMSAKGYDCGIWEACQIVHERDGVGTYALPEHKAWEVMEAYNEALDSGDNPWGPFVEYALQDKLDTMITSIV